MRKEVMCLVFVILLTSFVSASFNVDGYEITKDKYSPQNYLKAWVQMDLDKESSASIFETSVGDSVDLKKLLELNNVVKTCVPSDCESDYSTDGVGKESLVFTLEAGKSKIVGLKFKGEINSIDSINFSLESDAKTSCKNQLEIDFLGDEIVEKGNDKTSSEICNSLKNYGCFNSVGESERQTIEEKPYCQKINLSGSAGFRVGAWVKKNGVRTLEMIVYDKGANEKARCDLPDSSEEGKEVYCDVDYSVMKTEEHYICIKSKSGATEHQIKSNPSTKCGFFGAPIKSATTAYQIFAQGKKFADVGTLKINDDFSGGSIGQNLIEGYLLDKYDLDCIDGCVVPIKFTSNYDSSQTITLSNLDVKHRTSSGPTLLKKFYNLVESPAKISMDSQKLYLGKAEFSVTKNITAYGNETFVLKFGGKIVFEKTIFIEKVSTIESVNPLFASAANPTDFVIEVNEKNNSKIVNYKWEFGDGKNTTTLVNKTTHTYNGIKDYNLKVTIIDENGFGSSKTFNITVGSPKEIVNSEIDKRLSYVSNLKGEVENFTGFYKESVENILDLNASEKKLNLLRNDYNNASSDDDYILIMKELMSFRVPRSVYLVDKVESPFYPAETNIDVDILKSVGGGSYDSSLKKEYEEAVNDWYISNLEVNILNKDVVALYEQNDEPLLKIFELNIEKIPQDNYIIFNGLENLEFDKNYEEKSEGENSYIKSGVTGKIVFSTTSDVDVINLPVFIAPSISELNVVAPGVCNGNGICDKSSGENWKNCGDCSSTKTIIWIIGLLIAIGIVIYFILHIWYKRKYESHLFKDRNSLYNVVQYVHGAKQRGISREEVRRNLKKSGWTGEQIRYAMRKYGGKETGMWSPFSRNKSNTTKDTNNHRKV